MPIPLDETTPSTKQKEGREKRGRKEGEIGGSGENGGKEKRRKRKIKLIHVDLEEPEPGGHLAKPLGAAAADTNPGTQPPACSGQVARDLLSTSPVTIRRGG